MWERLKYTERFSFLNQSKVEHVVMMMMMMMMMMIMTSRWSMWWS